MGYRNNDSHSMRYNDLLYVGSQRTNHCGSVFSYAPPFQRPRGLWMFCHICTLAATDDPPWISQLHAINGRTGSPRKGSSSIRLNFWDRVFGRVKGSQTRSSVLLMHQGRLMRSPEVYKNELPRSTVLSGVLASVDLIRKPSASSTY